MQPSPYYPLMVVLAFVAATAYFVWSFWKKNLPGLTSLLIFSIFFVPFALLGARLWNYLNWPPLQQIVDQGSWSNRLVNFFGFGPSGLSGLSFFGGFFAIIIYFGFVFSWYAYRYQVSLWLGFDILLQAILIFQIIGRWGNFFNQELLGKIITTNYPQEYSWVPHWLGDQLHFPDEATIGLRPPLRHPLFLYESLANLFLLVILIVSKKIGFVFLLFQKHKPQPLVKLLTQQYQQLITQKSRFFWWRWQWWHFSLIYRFWTINICQPLVNFNETPPVYLNKTLGNWTWNDQSHLYQRQLLYVQQNLSFWQGIIRKFWMFWRRNSSALTDYFNPYQLFISRIGWTTVGYCFGYGIIRIVLQTFREGVFASEPIATPYYASGFLILLGFGIALWTQWWAPRKWRSPNWFYETWYWKR